MSNPIEVYERIALAIGKVCYWWSGLETLTRDMCHHVAAIAYPELEDPHLAAATVYLFADNMEMRERIVVLKALGCAALPLKDFERLEKLLNRIDNELRTERNRFVHDIWDVEEGKIYRIKMGSRVHRDQAFKPRVRLLTEKEYGSIEEVEAFVTQLEQAWRDLAEIDALTAGLVRPAQLPEPNALLDPGQTN